MQIDALIFQALPEPFHEDVVEEPALAIHRDMDARAAQAIRPSERRELAALVGVHDLGRAEPGDGLVQCINTEVRLQRVRDAPGQNFAGVPVHDGDQIHKAPPHRQIGDVGHPDLVGSRHPQTPQQIGVCLVPLCRLAGVGLLVDRHQAHHPHQSPDALFIHQMAFIA